MHQKTPLLVAVAVEPKTAADADKLAVALGQLTAISARLDSESGQTILHGASEAALEEACAQLHNLEIQFDVGSPSIAYRETITRPITIEYAHKRIVAGLKPEFALVRIAFEPTHDGSVIPDGGISFENTALNSIPPEFGAAVEKAIRAQAEAGVKAGFPVTGFCATLVKAAYHETDSSDRTFEVATRVAFRELENQNALQIVEPFMRIEVATPEDFLGGVIGDLSSRRAQAVKTIGGGRIYQLVGAMVPLANMFGYDRTLHSMTRGRATYELEFDHYEPIVDPLGYHPTFPGAMGMRVA